MHKPASTFSQASLPAPIQVPAGNKVAWETVGSGDITYECRDKANAPEAGTLHFPVNAERYLLASKLNFVSNLEDLWDIAMIETIHDVSLPYLSKTEGGYLDTVEGQQVAFSPRNAFFVAFKPTILGVSASDCNAPRASRASS